MNLICDLSIKLYVLLTLLCFCVFYVPNLPIVESKECGSLDLRNSVDSLMRLENCTVITGFLQIVLMESATEEEFTAFSFPKLREITGFLFIYRVFGLKSLGALFPNLAVIRGQNLITNYAFVIYELNNLQELGLKSLLSIQRGYVRIEKCPMLCYANTVKIDWSRITTPGPNYIEKVAKRSCPSTYSCRGCDPPNCWSSKNCQKFDTPPTGNRGVLRCHPQCIGGCTNKTANGCYICRGPSDLGVCVDKCPSTKLLYPDTLRCVTRKFCQLISRVVHHDRCLAECPSGYKKIENIDANTGSKNITCELCIDRCPKICEGFEIMSLSDAERVHGCTIINGTLQIRIVDDAPHIMTELEQNLGDIEEIYGYLKIYRSIAINSLSFLRNLTIIHGEIELEYGSYAMVLYENPNLQTIWNWKEKKDFKILNGHIFFHYNNKLCLSVIKELQDKINASDPSKDFVSTESNGYKHTCDVKLMESYSKVLSFENVTIYWEDMKPASNKKLIGYIVYYIETQHHNITPYYGLDACSEHSWKSAFITSNDTVKIDDKYLSFNLSNLRQFTQYGFYVRSYISETPEQHVGQTEVLYFKTKPNRPLPPLLQVVNKNETSLTLKWYVNAKEKDMIEYYLLNIFIQPDDYKYLDQRNYCLEPIVLEQVEKTFQPPERIPNCCVNDVFKEIDMFVFMHTLYGRSKNCQENSTAPECRNVYVSRAKRFVPNTHTTKKGVFEKIVNYDKQPMTYVRQKTIVKRQLLLNDELPFYKGENDEVTLAKPNVLVPFKIPATQNNFTVKNLKPYTLYSMEFYACTEEHKCSIYYFISERTMSLESVDEIEMILLNSSLSEGSIQFYVKEPKSPNGVIVGYNFMYSFNSMYDQIETNWCVTRKEHAANDFIVSLNHSAFGEYNFRGHAISLAGNGPLTAQIPVKLEESLADNSMRVSIPVLITIFIIIVITAAVYWRYKKNQKRLESFDRVVLMSDIQDPDLAEVL